MRPVLKTGVCRFETGPTRIVEGAALAGADDGQLRHPVNLGSSAAELRSPKPGKRRFESSPGCSGVGRSPQSLTGMATRNLPYGH
jgi:hypothetical protein